MLLVQDCMMGILKDKTILYVTHQVEFLPAADLILVNEKLHLHAIYQQFKTIILSFFFSNKKKKNLNSRKLRIMVSYYCIRIDTQKGHYTINI